MYFNVYFKEMKIGAQREAWQSEQLCAACCGPGCSGLTRSCGLPACRQERRQLASLPCPSALLHPAVLSH